MAASECASKIRQEGPARLVAARLLVLFLALVVALPAVRADSASFLAFGARIAGDESRTRIVVEFDREPEFSLRYLAGPPRIVVDLPETAFAFDEADLAPRGLFADIRYGAIGPGRARMVLEAGGPVKAELAATRKNEGTDGYRLVLDTVAASDSDFAALLRAEQWTAHGEATTREARGDRPTGSAGERERPFTVVIDAGHGGIDAGARGRSGHLEKDVTLAFARALRAALDTPGADLRVVMTREDDRFLSLGERVRVARQHEADLFVSLHADSIALRRIRGATVYTLSDKASDQMAAALARRENESDVIAGVAASPQPQAVSDILNDLTRRETQVFSIGLARSVIDSFKGQIRLINNPHRSAGFRVLQAPDVPSVLLELGYLSNREDEDLLTDPQWRDKVAGLLADSIRTYRSSVLAHGG